ncbi:unnamed protein product [Miscanthus lutarioriparius]|uniref:Uncharacterized protein n=1 Tax=Miscanthus lutarioriparius TaxID=422564 RepID=A0A811NVT4_9POAL|nr:unnamed protein product [Miscanthus lutarioriparius]
MGKNGIQYAVVSNTALFGRERFSYQLAGYLTSSPWPSQVDAFTAEPFKGNPAAVCLLEDAAKAADEQWMQSVAAEFNLSETAFLLRDSSASGAAPRFQLRWFTPAAEVKLCGHATLASAHFLFTSVLAEHEALIEFSTKSGILTAKKVPAPESTGVSGEGKLFIELDFPMIDLVDCHPSELPSIPETLNGASIVSVHKSTTAGDLIVELSSGKEVADIIPNFHEIKICSGRGIIVTGPAPAGSGYDFFTRFFCPKFGVPEDPVCGSAHCVLAPYWGGKLGKHKLTAFQASPRSGILYLELEAAGRRVRIQGEAVTVMTGTLLE